MNCPIDVYELSLQESVFIICKRVEQKSKRPAGIDSTHPACYIIKSRRPVNINTCPCLAKKTMWRRPLVRRIFQRENCKVTSTER